MVTLPMFGHGGWYYSFSYVAPDGSFHYVEGKTRVPFDYTQGHSVHGNTQHISREVKL